MNFLNFLSWKIRISLMVIITTVATFLVSTSPLLLPDNDVYQVVKDVPIVSTGSGQSLSRWGLEKIQTSQGRTWWVRYHLHAVHGTGYSDLRY